MHHHSFVVNIRYLTPFEDYIDVIFSIQRHSNVEFRYVYMIKQPTVLLNVDFRGQSSPRINTKQI